MKVRQTNIGFLLLVVAIASFILLPLISIGYLAAENTDRIWAHLLSTVLFPYLSNTALLVVLVATGAAIIGTGTAWLVTNYSFPGQRLFEWALLLPLAMPAYVVAYVYTDLLDYSGALQTGLRDFFGWQTKRDYWFPEIRSLSGAASMLILVLYPYVYLLTRSSFVKQARCYIDASRLLGLGPFSSFFSTALPLVRPALVVGVALVSMETIADYGTVSYFGVQTLSAGVFDVWLNKQSSAGAAQLALLMLIIVLTLLLLERYFRRELTTADRRARFDSLVHPRLKPLPGLFAFLVCFLPLFFGFLLPALVLVKFSLSYWQYAWTDKFVSSLFVSLKLSSSVAVVAVILALILAYANRLQYSYWFKGFIRLATMGYALPGAVVALGVLIPFAAFDRWFDGIIENSYGIDVGLFLSGSLFAIGFAYLVRFLPIAFGAVETSLERVTDNLDAVSRTLGSGPVTTLWRVHIPVVRVGLLTAVLLVFVDCMKELPATLLLRPFNVDTLATYVYQYASDELLEESSLAALFIVIAGLLPVIFLAKAIRGARPGQGN